MRSLRLPGPRKPRYLLTLTLAVGISSACAVPSGTLPRTPPAPPLPGASGLVLAARAAPELVSHDLSTAENAVFRLPPGVEQIFEARWTEDGSALVAARVNGANAIYEVTTTDAPEQLTDSVVASRFEIGNGKVVASRCRSVGPPAGPSPGRFEESGADRQTGQISVADLAGGGGWSEVARGCIAALSPAGDRLAYSPDGTSLWVTDLGGGEGREILDVEDLGLEAVERKQLTTKGPVVWGEAGVAVALDADGSDTIVLLSPEGKVRTVIPLEPQARDFFVGLSWSPAGELLAIPAYTYLGYVNATGSVGIAQRGEEGYRVVSVHPSASARAVWSPDGSSLLLGGDPREPWIVTELNGSWMQRIAGQEAVPFDWRES